MTPRSEDEGLVRAFSATNGPIGVLVLHGFTGSPASMRPLAESCANAGFSVELPLLPGHGTSPEDLASRSFEDFYAAAEREYLALDAACERVVVAGLSMGGLLALALAAGHATICGLVLINPYVEPPAASFLELLRGALASGARSIPSIGADLATPSPVPTGGYGETPIAPLLSLAEATARVAQRLSEITCPVLLLSSRVDHVVPPSSGDLVERGVAGPIERVFLEHSFHVATLDADAPEIEARTVSFVQKASAP